MTSSAHYPTSQHNTTENVVLGKKGLFSTTKIEFACGRKAKKRRIKSQFLNTPSYAWTWPKCLTNVGQNTAVFSFLAVLLLGEGIIPTRIRWWVSFIHNIIKLLTLDSWNQSNDQQLMLTWLFSSNERIFISLSKVDKYREYLAKAFGGILLQEVTCKV